MAKQRFLNTKFWSDNFIVKLDPLQRYLFLYFLTNEHTKICGIYELPLQVIKNESGLEEKELKKILPHFKDRLIYIDGWICIKNFMKHQSTSSITVQKGIETELQNVPLKIIDKLIDYEYPIDRVSGVIIYLNPNPNPNYNPNPNAEDEKYKKDINKIFNLFYKSINPTINFGNKTSRNSAKDLIAKFGIDKAVKMTEYAISVQGKKYAPVITTPYLLKEKLGNLLVYYARNKNDSQNIIEIL